MHASPHHRKHKNGKELVIGSRTIFKGCAGRRKRGSRIDKTKKYYWGGAWQNHGTLGKKRGPPKVSLVPCKKGQRTGKGKKLRIKKELSLTETEHQRKEKGEKKVILMVLKPTKKVQGEELVRISCKGDDNNNKEEKEEREKRSFQECARRRFKKHLEDNFG